MNIKNTGIFVYFFSQLISILLLLNTNTTINSKTSPQLSQDQLRIALENNANQNFWNDNEINVLKVEPEGARLGVCHNYAISKLLDLEGNIGKNLSIVGGQDWHEVYQFTKKYCKEVSVPEPGDLALYYKDNTPVVQHTGIVHSKDLVESKWGSTPLVLLHPTFNVPMSYGNQVKYYRITKSKEEILEKLKKRISACGYATRECALANDSLVYHTEQGNNIAVWEIGHRYMCADVESTNAHKQTLLMIAAKNNNLELAQFLKFYDADINKQDNNGKTALHLAAEKDNLSMISILLEYPNCNPNIEDNSGKLGLDDAYEYQNLKRTQYVLKRLAKPTKMAEKAFWHTMNS